MLRWLDIPPSWLIGAIALAFGVDALWPGLGFGWAWSYWLGNVLIVLGFGAMALALIEFLREKTSFIPRRVPSAFLKDGIYRLTRNPIYLGDALVLAGFILRWDVLVALVLVPLFGALISHRFIAGEEAGLRAAFGDEFDEWCQIVRRWF